jgi:hypothetical protein
MLTDTRLAHDGVVTEVVADWRLPSGSVSLTSKLRVSRLQSHVTPFVWDACPSRVGSTAIGVSADTPCVTSTMLTDGATAPVTSRSMQPTSTVDAVIVNGAPATPVEPGMLGEALLAAEHGAFERTCPDAEAPALSVMLGTDPSAMNVSAPRTTHLAPPRRIRSRDGWSQLNWFSSARMGV